MGNTKYTWKDRFCSYVKISEKSSICFRMQDLDKLEVFNTPAGTSPFYCRGYLTFDVAVVEPKGDYFLGVYRGLLYCGSQEESFVTTCNGKKDLGDWNHLRKDLIDLAESEGIEWIY